MLQSQVEEAAAPGVVLSHINRHSVSKRNDGQGSWNEPLQGLMTELQLLMSPPETPPGTQSAAMDKPYCVAGVPAFQECLGEGVEDRTVGRICRRFTLDRMPCLSTLLTPGS